MSNPPIVRLPMPEDIHNAFIRGEEAVTELFVSIIDTVRMLLSHTDQLREQ